MKKTRARCVESAFLWAVVFFVGCSPSEPLLDNAAGAVAEWNRNFEVLERGVSGGTLQGDEFEKACIFFEKLTSISIRGNASTLGYLPSAETREDISKLKEWFSANRSRLIWNEQERRISVAKPK